MPAPKPGGRPSLKESERIKARIVESATAIFLTQGYGGTSIEKIASDCGISKRTFYHRFENKAHLFIEVVHSIVARLYPAGSDHLFEGDDLESILLDLASAILDTALQPQALALHRIILAESAQFPELAAAIESQGSKSQALARIAAFFERQVEQQNLVLQDCGRGAELYFQMVLSYPQRLAMLGQPLPASALQDWARAAVNLFLNGAKNPL